VLHTYDSWKLATDPQLGEEPVEEEDELEEPEVTEKWDGTIVVTMASGHEFTIRRTSAGALIGDYEVTGDGVYRDGYLSPELALAWLTDRENWNL